MPAAGTTRVAVMPGPWLRAGSNREETGSPVGAVLSAAMMARHIGWDEPASLIETAVVDSVRRMQCTADIGGKLESSAAGGWMVAYVRAA